MNRFIYILILLTLLFISCATSHKHLTERLFLERERISITHPDGGSNSSSRTLGEQVNYTLVADEPENPEGSDQPTRLDTTQVYALPEVKVTSRTRFTSVREGYVDVDFVIQIPGRFISDDYQLCLTPELFHNDSSVVLADVVLRGKNFVEMQEQDYAAYEDYLSSLIDPSGYDTAFVDRKGLTRDIRHRRESGLNDYYSRWASVTEYWQWRYAKEEAYSKDNLMQEFRLANELSSARRKYEGELTRRRMAGADTGSLGRAYRKECNRLNRKYSTRKEITLASVPKKYREIHLQGLRPEDVQPALPAERDSLKLANEYLLHERILMNEFQTGRKDAVFSQLVPYPYLPDAHYNMVLPEGQAFSYRYTKRYPVKATLRNLKLTLKGMISATDRSTYSIKTDTLTYVISSLDELADPNLLANPAFTDESRKEYAFALQLLRKREYGRALNILKDYKDYNTVLALTCTGYSGEAYTLLRKIPATAQTHYLGAILCCRLKDEQAAVKHLKKSLEMDEDKIFRMEKDPEISELAKKYQLRASSVEN
ncbi:hypothetical protein [Bacteroides sp. 224]|uniref:hypothetical protein n=1 Tax=Bacteroides sp. 224 TaxID=2302936 RepID=UPI0013D762B1|nr:hypothetical protein [Bacteroides sp. 224]NDV66422.1 hypothetical protein [Bacteroides sp. 224]